MYISLDENNKICFKDSSINKILENDIQISDDIYKTFFEFQSQGKQFKVKNINGVTFNEIFEEYIPEAVLQSPNIEDRISSLEEAFKTMMGV